MVLVDNARRCRQANRAALRLFGLELSALTTRRLDDLVAEDPGEGLDVQWTELLEAGEGRGRFVVRRATGRLVEVRYSATARIVAELHLIVLVPSSPVGRGGVRAGGVLSHREREVLSSIAEGDDGESVARRLEIAPETVRRHISNARQKLGAQNRAHAVALALAHGEIRWPSQGGTPRHALTERPHRTAE